MIIFLKVFLHKCSRPSTHFVKVCGDALILLTRLHVVSHSDSAISLTGLVPANTTIRRTYHLQFTFSFLVFSGLSTAKRKFAESLNEFKFQCIGDAETDDEICIGELYTVSSESLNG